MRFGRFGRPVREGIFSAADLFQQLQHGASLAVIDAVHESADATEEIGQDIVQVSAALRGQFNEEHPFVIVAGGSLDQAFALQSLEQTGHGCPRYPRALREVSRAQRHFGVPVQQAQNREPALRCSMAVEVLLG